MGHRYRWAILVAATVGCHALVDAVAVVAPEIRDDGKFFSAAAVKKGDEIIREIYRQHDRDVVIETFATVPAADVEQVKSLDAAQRAAYFLQRAKDRAKERVVNGVYILICKDPRHLTVGVSEKEPHKFPPGSRDAIETTLVKEFKEGRFDE